jgi:hypothetical protein
MHPTATADLTRSSDDMALRAWPSYNGEVIHGSHHVSHRRASKAPGSTTVLLTITDDD